MKNFHTQMSSWVPIFERFMLPRVYLGMNNAFLIYRPAPYYDGSIEPLLICQTREQADVVVSTINEWMAKFTESLPPYPEEPEMHEFEKVYDFLKARESFAEEMSAVSKQREEIKRAAQWPYGLQLREDVPRRGDYDPSILEVMELPVVSRRWES